MLERLLAWHAKVGGEEGAPLHLRSVRDDHEGWVLEIESDHSPAHLILVLRASFRDEVSRVVLQLADEHGLVVYDPQQDAILVTGQLEATGGAEPCSCLGKPGTPGGADSWRAYGAARKGCALHGDD